MAWWSRLPDKRYDCAAYDGNKPNACEAKQREKRSPAPGLEKIDRPNHRPREVNERIIVIAEPSSTFAAISARDDIPSGSTAIVIPHPRMQTHSINVGANIC
jgi:hypothetical protein